MTAEWRDALRDRAQNAKDAAAALKDRALGLPKLRAMVEERTGQALSLDSPVSLNDKITWRKLYDRDPRLPMLCDKLAMRGYVAERLGPARAQAVLTELVGHSGRPTADWLRGIGTGVALRTNHASGWNALIRAADQPDWEALARKARQWLRRRYGLRKHEWAYGQVQPQLVADRLMTSADGALPLDIKMEMFHGRCAMIQLERHHGGLAIGRFLPDWTKIPLPDNPYSSLGDVPRPAALDEMREIAEILSEGFGYLRVDFLYTGTDHALNELTIYRVSGMMRMFAPEVGMWLGALWRDPAWPDRTHEAEAWLQKAMARQDGPPLEPQALATAGDDA